ncbi:MAG: FAD/FMN-containing dehydrogenase/Fe-S oxidoreductase [Desulforhopalus sp.]|jgi:FAD/FMN-containing dehydrogenase/Fe-S oxidoreductase
MNTNDYREIPYNFTSADDKLVINLLFGQEVWDSLEELRSQRITGRSARLVMRFIGDLFILRRNPFLFQELIDSTSRRHKFFKTAKEDLSIIEIAAAKVANTKESRQKVIHLVKLCRQQLKKLKNQLSNIPAQRSLMVKKLGPIIGKENVNFDPFSIISHATDATDWRLHLPLAVLRPKTEEQVPVLMKAVAELGLTIIPRGGGTGLTGGSVPLTENCVIINTERLTKIHDITTRPFPHLGEGGNVPTLKVEAGVVTSDAMKHAQKDNLVFATDPTSAWASTIGGNIAENAGGKTAVLWGTAIDNILSYSIAMPGQDLLTVRRINHPMRKILPDDILEFELVDSGDKVLKTIQLAGTDIRKKGLWKDITNKALGGLPGFQKEGTDGVITSGEFVLYEAYEKKITFCLEFFGQDMDEASRVIVEISEEFHNGGKEVLMALEHFDEEYIRAIKYKFKAARSSQPKAVLLIDMVGHNTEQIESGKKRLEQLLSPYKNTELFIAQDADEAERFWRDRKRLGAISARTNAFKLNEDIVLPLSALAEFTRFVDKYNIEEDVINKEQFIHKLQEYLETAEPLEDPDWLEAKIPKATELCKETLAKLALRTTESVRHEAYIKQLMADLLELFSGYEKVSSTIEDIFTSVRSKRIIIATHMHAGDGNNHVNIPVFSNDRKMMKRAEKTAEDVMKKTVELGGVVSGEHGIGITKMKFLEENRLSELVAYRKDVDPDSIMNPGMLSDPEIIDKVFTPSFNLLELEAKILQYGSLAKLSSMISKCIRCGKCMPVCCVYFPGTNIFFHPRNKNMVIGSLIEALLYDVQRSHHPRFNQLKNLEEIADHCTMCRKCLAPCPVDIDTAEVSILEREILSDFGYKHTAPATKLSLMYLQNRNKIFNSVFRKGVMEWGSSMQRVGAKLFKQAPPTITENEWRPLNMLKSPMAAASTQPLTSLLPQCSENEALIVMPESGEVKTTVFYFPGCGSERLFSDIAVAAIYLLAKNNIRTILPPPYLCCGFPAKVNAKKKMAGEISLRDTIILSQIKEMLGHFVFDSFLISCGTCRESLHEIGCEEIFNCGMDDVSNYVLENSDWDYGSKKNVTALYHTPCHDSFKGEGVPLLKRFYNDVESVPNCCSEAGTLAISRPDISFAMLERKRESIAEKTLPGTKLVMATNCPSCLSGLGRNSDLNIEPKHMAVLLAENLGGKNWKDEFESLVAHSEKVTF